MITNLRSAKARLSELVDRAASGEEVWLTVRGKPKARICAVAERPTAPAKKAWLAHLKRERARPQKKRHKGAGREFWDELRADR